MITPVLRLQCERVDERVEGVQVNPITFETYDNHRREWDQRCSSLEQGLMMKIEKSSSAIFIIVLVIFKDEEEAVSADMAQKRIIPSP